MTQTPYRCNGGVGTFYCSFNSTKSSSGLSIPPARQETASGALVRVQSVQRKHSRGGPMAAARETRILQASPPTRSPPPQVSTSSMGPLMEMTLRSRSPTSLLYPRSTASSRSKENHYHFRNKHRTTQGDHNRAFRGKPRLFAIQWDRDEFGPDQLDPCGLHPGGLLPHPTSTARVLRGCHGWYPSLPVTAEAQLPVCFFFLVLDMLTSGPTFTPPHPRHLHSGGDSRVPSRGNRHRISVD